jgi:tRNA(fMet)-specific endonuclease VapC
MFMLDTDTCSYVLKYPTDIVAQRFEENSGSIAISEIVLAELRFGAENHPTRTSYLHSAINTFADRLDVIPWAASVKFGELRAYLKRNGTPIGILDTLIAAHSLQLGFTLVTNNNKHYRQVPDLRIENWT